MKSLLFDIETDGLLADNPADWANNSIDIVLEKGTSKGYNATLRNGFRLEGTLSHDGEGIAEEQIAITNADFRANSYNVFTNEDGYFNTCTRGGFLISKLPPRLVYTSYQLIIWDLADLVRISQDLPNFFS